VPTKPLNYAAAAAAAAASNQTDSAVLVIHSKSTDKDLPTSTAAPAASERAASERPPRPTFTKDNWREIEGTAVYKQAKNHRHVVIKAIKTYDPESNTYEAEVNTVCTHSPDCWLHRHALACLAEAHAHGMSREDMAKTLSMKPCQFVHQ